MQRNRASSRGEKEVSWFLSSSAGNLGYILELRQRWPFKLVFVHQRQDSCLVVRDTSGISSRLGRAIGTLLEVRQQAQCPFLVARVILVFLSFSRRVRHRLLLKHELRMPLEVSKGCEASCPDEAGT